MVTALMFQWALAVTVMARGYVRYFTVYTVYGRDIFLLPLNVSEDSRVK